MNLTVPSDTLVCDTAQIALWQSDPAYAYHRELMTPEVNFFQWLDRMLGEWLNDAFDNPAVADHSEQILIGIGVLLIVLLAWFVCKKHPGLFTNPQKNAAAYAAEADTIYGIDFDRDIRTALSRNDYREAVRLLYLQTLKQLSDTGRIDWQPYKTPTQYLYEVRVPAFRTLTHHFLRVRYGNFEATEETFRTLRSLQEEVEKGGDGA